MNLFFLLVYQLIFLLMFYNTTRISYLIGRDRICFFTALSRSRAEISATVTRKVQSDKLFSSSLKLLSPQQDTRANQESSKPR